MGRHSADAPGFRPDVEGLRGVAVLAVVLFHAGVPGTDGGYVGVDVFYVLSGFLITGLLLRDVARTGRVGLADFWARRARRLLPAAVVVLLATTAASLALLPPLRAEVVVRDAVAAALYAGNVRAAAQQTDYLTATDPPSPLQHYWSLGVEEQYYLVWPLLVLAVAVVARRRGRPVRRALAVTTGAVAVTSFAAGVWLTEVAQPWAFFSMPTRAWELAAGAGVALAAPRLADLRPVPARLLRAGGLTAVLAAVVLLSERTAYPGVAALLPVLGSAAVLVAGCAGAGDARLLGSAPLRLAGRLSYSWYLWHWPVLVLPAEVLGRDLRLVESVPLALVSAGLAALTLTLVEDPVRYAPRLRAPRVALPAGLALTAVAALLPVAGATTLPALDGGGRSQDVAPVTALAPRPGDSRGESAEPVDDGAVAAGKLPTPEALVAAAVQRGLTVDELPADLTPSLRAARADLAHPYAAGCHVGYRSTEVVTCTGGDREARATVALLGDSHAVQWYPALDEVGQARGWRLRSLTKNTCPPFDVRLSSPVLERRYTECEAWRQTALRQVVGDGASVAVLGVARHYEQADYDVAVGGPAWLRGLGDTVQWLTAAGVRVVVLGATPRPQRDIPDCLSDNTEAAWVCATPRERALDDELGAAERAAVTAAGGSYVDVADWACTARSCPAVVEDLLVYRDDNHLTQAYPRYLVPVVDRALPPV